MSRVARWTLLVVGWAAVVTVTMLAVAPVCVADIIRLKDGGTLEGEIRRTDDGWVVTADDGRRRLVPFDRVVSIEARPKGGGDVAEQRLASLRRAADSLTDIRQILDRYRAFITQYDGTPAGDKARADVQAWADRLDRGMVKLGDKWVTPEEKAATQQRSVGVAREAADMLRQGRMREAVPLLDKAIADNPQSAALWYLKGVLLYRQDQLPQARKAFESAAALLPDHAPTLNNLAIVLWRQNAHPAALNTYDRALLASPANRQVLDNLAEALNALPEDLRHGAMAKKVVRHFNEQDRALQEQMAKAGLFRWGSTWVSKEDLEKLKAAERDIQDKLDALSQRFDGITARLSRIDSDIRYDEQIARRMELDSYGVDPATGRQIRYPLPAGYYDLVRDISALKAERAQRLAQQDQMRQEAKQLRQKLPTPKYTGLQRLIDTDGAPIPATVADGGPAAPDGQGPAAGAVPPAVPAAPAAPAAPFTSPAPPAPTTEPAAPTPAPPAEPSSEPKPPTPPSGPPPEKPSILDRRFGGPDRPGLPPGPPPGG